MDRKNMRYAYDLIMETHEEFIRIRSGIERMILPITQAYGLTTTQAAVLNIIRKMGKATVSDLFKALDFNQGNMSSLCKKLEADGFVVKTKCTHDERKCYLTLTDKAQVAIDGIDAFFLCDRENRWLTDEEFAEAEAAIAILRTTANTINEKLLEAVETIGESTDA